MMEQTLACTLGVYECVPCEERDRLKQKRWVDALRLHDLVPPRAGSPELYAYLNRRTRGYHGFR
jgi:hypothetical protein